MITIRARNVQQALPEALYQLRLQGRNRESRNGPVVMFPEPVTTVYDHPAERVIFWAERDANPFFHLFESLWMLGGRNDVKYVAAYVERMRDYSDDGATFHGAYGYRWRAQFGFDQLPKIIAGLRENKDDRRQVLSMWDTRADLGRGGKDIPCNLQAIFQISVDGELDMMVTNRSNDIIWGAYGANAVHFSYLHEYVARAVGVEQGVYRQVSANFHAYRDVLEKVDCIADRAPNTYGRRINDPYDNDQVKPFPLMSIEPEAWMKELDMFLTDPGAIGFRDPFFRRVAIPMAKAHAAFKAQKGVARFAPTFSILGDVEATDWHKAAVEWVVRRRVAFEGRKARAEDSGVVYE